MRDRSFVGGRSTTSGGQTKPLSSLLGYDPDIVRHLSEAHQGDLDSLAQAWLFSCVLLSFPMGLAVWLVEHSPSMAILAVAGTFLLVLTLLRLVTSGSGTAPEHRLHGEYRPSLLPVVLLAGLALLMSQPAQLLSPSQTVRAEVERHRAVLIEAHLDAQTALADVLDSAPAGDAFLEQLKRCEFVVMRLKLLWTSPESTVLWSALFVAAVLVPAAFSRVLWLDAVLAYERGRYRRERVNMRRMKRATDRDVERLLARFPSYRVPWMFPLATPLGLEDVDLARAKSAEIGEQSS